MTALSEEFFARATVDVARDLVGAALISDEGGSDEVRAIIVEVEAYLGRDDPASHAFRGPTPRSSIMFGSPGRLYIYLSYGMHHCANIVCEPEGTAGAVLLRAAAVERGSEVVRRRRARPGARAPLPEWALLSGPGNLSRGLGLTLGDNGASVCGAPPSRVQLDRPSAQGADVGVEILTRVGISQARDRLLRFTRPGHPAVKRSGTQGLASE